MSSVPFLLLGAGGYLFASVFYVAYLLQTQQRQQITYLHAGRLSGVLAVLFHTTAIGLHCLHTHNTPISTGPEAISATGWAIAIVYFCVEIANWKRPPSALGAVAFPIAFLSIFTGSTLSVPARHLSHGIGALKNPLISLHIVAIIFAFGLLTLAVCCSLFYLVEHRLLKQKKAFAGIYLKLPPLATVDHLAFTLVCFAFPLLSLGIVSGIIRAASSPAPLSQWATDPPTMSAVVCWAIYGIYLWAHNTSNWQGLKSNYLLVAGLLVVLVTYFAPSHLHRFS